jgi:HAD superfamily phosphatase
MEQIVVFDMDGVLAEVTESYRQAIVETVAHFTGKRIERDLIQD